MKILFLTILGLVFLQTSYGQSEPTPQKNHFTDYITKNKAYVTHLKQKQIQLFEFTYPDCDEEITIKRHKPDVKSPIQFATMDDFFDKDDAFKIEKARQNPIRGQWIEKALVTGCGQTLLSNHIAIGYNIGKIPKLYPVTNGRTKINPIFQSQAEQAISKILKTPSIGCHGEIFAQNTQFLGYRAKQTNALVRQDENSGWFERWTISACRKNFKINLAILPDPRTTYRYLARVQN